MQNPIVFFFFLHGTNAGPWTMANFADYFSKKGFACHRPAYRYHDPSPVDETVIKGLSIADYVDDIALFVWKLNAQPIVIGRSVGGIVAQKLAMTWRSRRRPRDLSQNGTAGVPPFTRHKATATTSPWNRRGRPLQSFALSGSFASARAVKLNSSIGPPSPGFCSADF